MRPPRETPSEVASVWERWLDKQERSPWVIAMRALENRGLYVRDWGGGLPGRSHGLLPCCISIENEAGEQLYSGAGLKHLRALAA